MYCTHARPRLAQTDPSFWMRSFIYYTRSRRIHAQLHVRQPFLPFIDIYLLTISLKLYTANVCMVSVEYLRMFNVSNVANGLCY